MIAQPITDDTIVQLFLLIIALVLTIIMLYLSMRIITSKKDTNSGYILRLIIVAVIIVIGFPAISAAINYILNLPGLDILASAGLASIVIILLFVILIYVIKILLMPDSVSYERWERAIWISTLAVFFILLINSIGMIVINMPLVRFFV
ncbi:MAG: hypothetical protein ACXAEU_25700 [Candidatus Hodarchaeales archaeon]